MSYSVSKLSAKCQNCPHKDDCGHKTMMMCAVADISQSNTIDNGVSYHLPFTRDISVLSRIQEDINKSIMKQLSIGFKERD